MPPTNSFIEDEPAGDAEDEEAEIAAPILEESDEEDGAASAYFAAQRRPKRKRAAERRTLASVAGAGSSRDLLPAVLKLLEPPTRAEQARVRSKLAPQYGKWLSLLLSGFSLLVHGFGSKKDVLEDFAGALAARAPVLVLHGYSASAKPSELLQLLLQKLRVPAQGSSAVALCAQVRRAFAAAEERERAPPKSGSPALRAVDQLLRAPRAEAADDAATDDDDDDDDDGGDDGAADDGAAADAAPSGAAGKRRATKAKASNGEPSERAAAAAARSSRVPEHVYVIIHAIDGVALRAEACQSVLASLAAIPQVHLIASASHQTAPLLWDSQQARMFNWAWVEGHTAAPYSHECRDTIHEFLSTLYDSAHATEGRSAQLVLQALTANAQAVFKELVRHQIDNPRSAGLSFPQLYERCRANFSASSESALHRHINEFTDHHLVKTRKGDGGQQCFYCSLSADLMKEIVAPAEG